MTFTIMLQVCLLAVLGANFIQYFEMRARLKEMDELSAQLREAAAKYYAEKERLVRFKDPVA